MSTRKGCGVSLNSSKRPGRPFFGGHLSRATATMQFLLAGLLGFERAPLQQTTAEATPVGKGR
jgi:hypothetical protein